MKSWNVNWWSNIIVNYFDDGIHDLSCLLTMSVTNNIYLCSWPLFLKFSLYIQLASQLSRGVLIDISCTNCDNVSSHCHIMFTGTRHLVTERHYCHECDVCVMAQCPAHGGRGVTTVSVSGVKHRRALTGHYRQFPQCTGETQELRAPGPGPGEGPGSGHHGDTRSWLFVIVL